MNFARRICAMHRQNVGSTFNRKFGFSASNLEATQPQVQEGKFDFEDLKVLERTERRKPKIRPFMKDVFVSVFNKDLLAYPEFINKEESECLNKTVEALESIFNDSTKSRNDRKQALLKTKMYAAPVSLTHGGLAMNYTESLRCLEVIASDIILAQEISDHWVGLEALSKGLEAEQYQQIIDHLISGEQTIKLCLKERISEKITQPDFRTKAEINSQGIWHITGEKVCISNTGYLLVLCSVEAGHLKAFLVHPNASGVEHKDQFVSFRNTPGTPLGTISEQNLSQILGGSRLHAATLCRTTIARAVKACVDYVRPKFLSGKPLSEVSSIRATIGNGVLDLYASESAEYFTAGLLDMYEEPDAEMEMAMCRNFMLKHGLSRIIELLEIPALEQEVECKRVLEEIRQLAAYGDSSDSINMFIALNGIHHAGKMMAEEIKQIRNPLFHPTFMIKKIITNRHQEKDDPKLELYLADYLHPSLRVPSERLEYCVLRMRYACETMMSRHGMEVAKAFTELNRLAEAATEILAMSAVLARASRSYCIGLRNSELEMKLATCYVGAASDRVKALIKAIEKGEYLNLDCFTTMFGKKALDATTELVEKPIARTFW
ncbi:hypothetical protein ACJJTC_009611 [Scirpophaga incertulas]